MQQPFYLHQPEVFPGSPTSSLRDSLIVAPYWSDIDLRLGGSVFIQPYSNTESTVPQMALESIRNLTGLATFVPLGMLVVTWENVLPAGSQAGASVSEGLHCGTSKSIFDTFSNFMLRRLSELRAFLMV